MLYRDKNSIRDEENEDIVLDFSEMNSLKNPTDEDEYCEMMINKETINFKIEVVDDGHFLFIRVRKKDKIKNEVKN